MYEIYQKPADRLKQYIFGSRKQFYTEFWALREISFDVYRGETLGIIGRNGAGKTTLLQCIAGTLSPTTGSTETQGRMTAMLELGSGFNPEFTGRENVFLNGTVLGIAKKEMQSRLESIESFADIGAFFDRPVKTYSKGMYARLAFSILANIDPDIFIVDEALAVGDAIFRHRCMHRIDQMKERGVTILYVAHDASSMKRLCDRVAWIEDGSLRMIGDSSDVVDAYLEHQFKITDEQNKRVPVQSQLPPQTAVPESPSAQTDRGTDSASIISDSVFNEHETIIPGGDYRVGDRRLEVQGIGIYDEQGRRLQSFESGMPIWLRMTFKNNSIDHPGTRLQSGWTIRDLQGEPISATNTGTEQSQVPCPQIGRCTTISWKLLMPKLRGGSYSITMGLSVLDEEGEPQVADRVVNAAVIQIHAPKHVHGLVHIPVEIEYHTESSITTGDA
jgi:ABC-type polysaccharide/polyol phosphate transport system ATPase subunit